MERVQLVAKTGAVLAEVDIPKCSPRIDVVAWGLRVFVRQANGKYREGSLYVVPPLRPAGGPPTPPDDPGS